MKAMTAPLLLLAGFFGSGTLQAADVADSDAAEFGELLSVMSEETDVATKTRMNSDFVPGIVTVLDGEHLAALGVRTVWEALPFVPGVQAIRDPRGSTSSTVRGIPFPFNNGNLLILLNGVPMSRDSAGVNSSALDVPVAQVERIEFVRGPGSVVYGEFAFQGLVNIVTRDSGSGITLEGDSRDTVGAHLRQGGKAGDWKISANLSGADSDEAVLPKTVAATDKHRFGVLSAQSGGFSFHLQGIQREQEDSDPAAPNVSSSDDSASFDAAYQAALSADADLKVRSQYLVNLFDNGNNRFDGTQWRSGADILWRGWTRQSWLAGVEYTAASVDTAVYTPPVPPPPAPPPPPPAHIDVPERQVLSFLLQDQIELTPALQMTLGARHDDNNEIGTRVTPRFSLAWHPAEHHILKVQYAEGYRSPTFFELYSDPSVPDLDFEVNKTSELNYIFQQPDTTLRATVFHTRITDMIFRDTSLNAFTNGGEAQSDGVELEWTQQVASFLRIDANASTADSRNNRNPALTMQDIDGSADWMTNLGLLWTPVDNLLFGVHWNHVGPRPSAPTGDEEYDLVNLTLTRRNLFAQGLDVQVGVYNALDTRVVYLHPAPSGDLPLPYEDQIVRAGLTWHLR